MTIFLVLISFAAGFLTCAVLSIRKWRRQSEAMVYFFGTDDPKEDQEDRS